MGRRVRQPRHPDRRGLRLYAPEEPLAGAHPGRRRQYGDRAAGAPLRLRRRHPAVPAGPLYRRRRDRRLLYPGRALRFRAAEAQQPEGAAGGEREEESLVRSAECGVRSSGEHWVIRRGSALEPICELRNVKDLFCCSTVNKHYSDCMENN